MKQYLKQFTEWGTGLRHNVFLKARLKLTLYYALFMAVIIGLFSMTLLSEIDKNMHAAYRRHMVRNDIFMKEFPRTPVFDAGIQRINRIYEEDFLEASKAVRTLIYTVDAVLLALIVAASYVLAGRTLRPVKQALDDQKRFVADVSHDLRTPLAIMKTETEVALQDGEPSSSHRDALKSNLEEIDKMSSLVSDLLLLARTEGVYQYADTLQTGDAEPISMTGLMNRISERMGKQAALKNIELSFANAAKGDALVEGHLNHLERAIQNIVQNAINYTPEHGHVATALSEHGSSFRITVKDTGVGISKADLPHVFNRFYKASHSRSSSSGSGLGLPIAKQIIEQHKGTIEISSKEGKGTEVHIQIPRIRG
ncbi:MAG TPA: HAMP domain-containing sensor histidine kinase [Candidatus Paceibacterota bacterium]